MILDFLTNWKCYARGNEQVWKEAFDFINSLDGDTEEKRFSVHDDAIFAFVQGYETHPVSEGKIEIHRDYIDIHSIITGREMVYYSPVASLELLEDFTPGSDDLLYSYKPEEATGFQLSPGRFALFFPEEGHMTRIQISETPERIKKVVLKIAKGLLYK